MLNRTVALAAIAVLALTIPAFGWSNKEHLQLTRIAALRLINAADTPADMKAWLREAMVQEPAERSRRLEQWASAPAARAAHPREEHLLPLMVASGAAGDDRAIVGFNDTFGGLRLSSYHFGVTAR